MKLPSPRYLLRPILTCMAAAALIVGLGSCLVSEIKIFFQSELKRGIANQGFSFSCDAAELELADFSRPIIVRFLEEDDGAPVVGVTVSGPVEVGNVPLFTEFHTEVDVGLNAAAHWVRLEATFSVKGQAFGIIKAVGRALISSVEGRPPPDITEVIGAEGARARALRTVRAVPGSVPAIERGSPARVEFIGANFDETAAIFAEDPTVIVSDVTYSEETGSVLATIAPPANGRTGRSRFFMTTSGGRSSLAEILVRAGTNPSGNRPVLVEAYPNAIEAGVTSEVTLTGNEFVGAGISIEPANPNVTVTTEVVDANTIRATFEAGSSASGSVMLVAQSSGGKSDPIALSIAAPGTPLPRITSLGRDRIPSGNFIVGVQVKVVGENLVGTGRVERCHLLPNPEIGEFGFQFIAYEPTDPAVRDTKVVVILSVSPKNNGDPLPAGPLELALRRTDGLTTNVLPMFAELPSPPTEGRPVVTVIFPSGVRRPDTLLEEISGERLTDITGIVFDHPGVTATFIDERPDGTRVRFSFATAADAVITGDEATNFHIVTEHGASRDVSYIVRP